jgi:hypothetical protein
VEWYEYEYKKWGNGEWDIPIDYALLDYIFKSIKAGRNYILEDCLTTPSGSVVTGFYNAYMWNGIPRVLYSYKTKDGTAPATGLLRFMDEDRAGHAINLEPIVKAEEV